LRFVTPDEGHRGEDRVLLANRHQVCELAPAARPERWSGKTRNWQPIGPVWLNPERPDAGRAGHGSADALTQEAGGGGPMAGLAKRAAQKRNQATTALTNTGPNGLRFNQLDYLC
jgi:ABC-type phosphate transport system substrate-binding protein